MNTGTKMALAVLGGIGAGVCFGLLMAPDKGSNNRKKLVTAAGDWADKLKHLFSSDGQAKISHARHNGTSRTARTVSHRTQSRRKP
ncbi:MAG TPA: YtxH domain-containing protein [Chitinophagaceae bacterium]|nr:YtxH domain-containing protein [Chitinophagaceae bacterium]